VALFFIQPNVSVSNLFCDKFTFTVDYNSADEKQHILQTIKELKSYKCMYAGSFSKMHYKEGIFVCPDENKLSERMLILCGPKKPGKAFLRVGYNPARIDADACWNILNALLPGGIEDIQKFATCTRLDATVDVTGVHPDQILVYYPKMQVSRSFRKGGHCETLEMGRYDGDKRIVVYDKVAKIKHWNEKHAMKQPVPDKPTTRIEIVLRPGLPFNGMLGLTDMFSPLNIAAYVPTAHAETKSETFRMFIAASQVHGAHDMLLLLNESTRKAFKKILGQSACPWWQPAKLWGQWPALVARTFSVGQPSLLLAA